MTTSGAEPATAPLAPIDYQYYVDRQLAPVADGILGFVDASFADLTDRQFGLFDNPMRRCGHPCPRITRQRIPLAEPCNPGGQAWTEVSHNFARREAGEAPRGREIFAAGDGIQKGARKHVACAIAVHCVYLVRRYFGELCAVKGQCALRRPALSRMSRRLLYFLYRDIEFVALRPAQGFSSLQNTRSSRLPMISAIPSRKNSTIPGSEKLRAVLTSAASAISLALTAAARPVGEVTR